MILVDTVHIKSKQCFVTRTLLNETQHTHTNSMPRKGKPEHKRRNLSQGQHSPGTTPPSNAPPSPHLFHLLNRVLTNRGNDMI